MPRLLREIVVSSLSRQEGLAVVDASAAGADLPRLLDKAGCHVLMLACKDAEISREEELLLRGRPRLRVLALDGEGRRAALYESAAPAPPRKLPLGEVSMERLVAAIRASAARLETAG